MSYVTRFMLKAIVLMAIACLTIMAPVASQLVLLATPSLEAGLHIKAASVALIGSSGTEDDREYGNFSRADNSGAPSIEHSS